MTPELEPDIPRDGHRRRGRYVRRRHQTAVALLILASLALLSACAGAPNMLDPVGPRADRIATMWWVMLVLATLMFVTFVGLFLVVVFQFREGRQQRETRSVKPATGNGVVIALGFVVPVLILGFLTLYTNRLLNVLAAPDRPAALTVEVIGYQFWWEVRYPEQGVVTANEIHVPTGRPVTMRVTSADVIHSFWTPQIHDKIDMIPGQSKSIWIEVDQPGEYRGLCAEFCGIQHALMQFLVIAQPPEEFDAWLAARQQPAPPVDPLVRRGQEVFVANVCISCHSIGGAQRQRLNGPDLTHVASRRTLGAAIIPNTPENLAAFIRDPQSIKPGNRMPAVPLREADLEALVAYLLTLE
jgi:cytochrome c oxidase subunit II